MVVAGHRLGEAGGQHGVAADVERLLADLHDAAHDHVVDQGRVEVVALDQGLQGLGAQVGGVPVAELPVALAPGGADCVDDDGVGHGSPSVVRRNGFLPAVLGSWSELLVGHYGFELPRVT